MEWIANPQQIADGYGIDVEDWIDSVTGSTTSFLTEAKVAKLLGGKRVIGSQKPYDVIVWNILLKAYEIAPHKLTIQNDDGEVFSTQWRFHEEKEKYGG